MNDDTRHSQDNRRLSTQDIAAAATPDDDGRDGVPADTRPHENDRAAHDDDRPAALFVAGDAAGYRTRWSAIQTGFVDEPRNAVAEADALVAEVMKRLAEVFAEERSRSKPNGKATIRCLPRSSARPCGGTGRSSKGCSPCDTVRPG